MTLAELTANIGRFLETSTHGWVIKCEMQRRVTDAQIESANPTKRNADYVLRTLIAVVISSGASAILSMVALFK
jgi:hypothetical protein